MSDVVHGRTTTGVTFRCDECGVSSVMATLDRVPVCPECGGSVYQRSTEFTSELSLIADAVAPPPTNDLDWVREQVAETGSYLAYLGSNTLTAWRLGDRYTRIGRSLTAEIRFDDATVSRRHALVMCEQEKHHLLDDRSLNGVFVNGVRIERRQLSSGDHLLIGRHELVYVEVP